jgi:hypothetical protein
MLFDSKVQKIYKLQKAEKQKASSEELAFCL